MSTNDVKKLVDDLQKSFGEGAAFFASDMKKGSSCSSGSLALDFATGIGGLPTNRVVEICGEPGAGKSTLALMVMRSFLLKFPDRGVLYLETVDR